MREPVLPQHASQSEDRVDQALGGGDALSKSLKDAFEVVS